MLLTPLEQFQIISLIPLTLFGLDFSFTNLFLISLNEGWCYNSFISTNPNIKYIFNL